MAEPRTVSIVLPELGAPARLSLWLVRPGEHVYEGEHVAEALLPGATFDVASPASGVVGECLVRPNEPIRAGQVLGTVVEAD